MNSYPNKTINSCILKLHLPVAVINKIFKYLYQKNETSGVFYFNDKDTHTHITTKEGDTGSVQTDNNVINYHTHPINAYRQGRTCYGWPSGEDHRECLKFALAGNKAHLVFSVEGVYTIQVSPCKITKLKELLNDTERGALIFVIEEYFKTLHEFRCVDELNDLNLDISPYSYVNFANTFDIKNLLSPKQFTHKNPEISQVIDTSGAGHSGIRSDENFNRYTSLKKSTTFCKIPNMGFPNIHDTYIVTKQLNKHISKNDLENLRSINKQGTESDSPIKSVDNLIQMLNKIANLFDAEPCSSQWNNDPNKWFYVNFFPSQHYCDGLHKRKNKCLMPETLAKNIYINNEIFIRAFSNSREGCKVTEIAKKNNFNMGKMFRFGSVGKKCSCCKFGKCPTIDVDIQYLRR